MTTNKAVAKNKKASAPETRECPYELGQAIEVEWQNIDTKQSEWRPATFSLSYESSDRPWRAIITTTDGRRIREVAPECIRPATGEGNAPRGATVRIQGLMFTHQEIVDAFNQRDELLAACKAVADLDLAAVDCGMIPNETWKRLHALARAAIAKVEGSAS